MKIRQYRPAFFEGFDTEEFEGSIDAILALPWVARFKDDLTDARFCWSHHRGETQWWLMIDGKNHTGEREWWVIGSLDAEPTALPEWHAPPSTEWPKQAEYPTLEGEDLERYKKNQMRSMNAMAEIVDRWYRNQKGLES